QVHHRLFLTNTSDDVSRFSIHYGYNFFLVGRAWRTHGLVVHASGGGVVPNPDKTPRGKSLNPGRPGALDVGYRLGGVGAAFAVSRQAAISKHFYVLADGGVLTGWTRVPVVDGSASVPTVGVHGHVGVGIAF